MFFEFKNEFLWIRWGLRYSKTTVEKLKTSTKDTVWLNPRGLIWFVIRSRGLNHHSTLNDWVGHKNQEREEEQMLIPRLNSVLRKDIQIVSFQLGNIFNSFAAIRRTYASSGNIGFQFTFSVFSRNYPEQIFNSLLL